MRYLLPLLALPLVCGACAGEAPVAQTPPPPVAAPASPPPPPAAPLTIASAPQSEADRLVAQAQEIRANTWRDDHRRDLVAANTAAGLAPTPAQLEAQLDRYQTERLTPIFAAMREAGGASVLAYCAEVAESEAVPVEQRALALSVLQRHVDRSDPQAAARMARIAERLATLSAPSAHTPTVSNAAAVVASLRGAFARCYAEARAADPQLTDTLKVKLALVVDASGAVSSAAAEGDGPATFTRCLTEAGRKARFAAPDGGKARLVIPLMFAQ